MKTYILFLTIIATTFSFAQEVKPTFKKEGKMIKATYFHDNGEIAQTGYLLNNKLHGPWVMFNNQGKKIATGKYVLGNREGKWFFWKGDILSEVDFKANKMTYVKNWNSAEIVAVQ